MSKSIKIGVDHLKLVLKGITTLANAVKVTLGPKGRTVILYKGMGDPHITKDGVTVAEDIVLENHHSNDAARVVKQVSKECAELSGDGTTTATVLAAEIFKNGYNKLVKTFKILGFTLLEKESKVNAMDLQRGINLAVKKVTSRLKKESIKITDPEEVFNIATISANNDKELGRLIADAYDKLGNDVKILTEESNSLKPESSLEVIDGMKLDKGFLTPSFTNDDKRSKVEYDNPMFLLVPGKLTNFRSIIRPVEISHGENKPLVIIAEDFDENVIKFLVKNYLESKVPLVAMKAPGMGEERYQSMLDIAAITGSKTLEPHIGEDLSKVTVEQLGSSKKIVMGPGSSVIFKDDNNDKDYLERVTKVQESLDSLEVKKGYHYESLSKRLAVLKGKIALIKLGALTDAEMNEKRDRIDDAIAATKSAIEEGYLAGGGLTLLVLSKLLERDQDLENKDIELGYDLLIESLKAPFNNILLNAGKDPKKIANNLLKKSSGDSTLFCEGYNSLTDKYEHLIINGVIDPVKVTRLALENAASIAGLLLTSRCSISLKN